MGLFGSNDAPLENADIDCEPQNEYVSKETVAKIDDILDRGEMIHFLSREAGGGIKLEGAQIEAEKKTATGGHIRAAATDRRVVCKIPNIIGGEELSIPYDSISTVDLKSGLVWTRISLQTDMKTYGIDVGFLSDDTAKSMSRFIREKVSEANQTADASVQDQASNDPLEQLEHLRELKEDGVVSEQEFSDKKQDLLEKM